MARERVRLSQKRRRVRGINSDLSGIRLLGEEFRVGVDYEMQPSVRLARTIEGASTLTIPLLDPDCRLLGSKLLETKFDVELDDLWFRLAAIDRQGDLTTLTFEDREVAYMRKYDEPRKVLRSKVTRAEFILSMVKEVKEDRIPTFILELHKEQPIADSDTPNDREIDVKGGRRGGDASITSTHSGWSDGYAKFCLLVAAGTGISLRVLGAWCLAEGGLDDNPLNIRRSDGGFSGFGSPEAAARAQIAFLTTDDTAGFYKGIVNAANDQDCMRAIIDSPFGTESLSTLQSTYQTVEVSGSVGKSTGGGGTTTVDKPYAFERKDGEDSWTCAGRLADEVQWRRFMSAGVFYYASEADLFLGPVLMDLDEPHPRGINDVSFNWDGNKRDTEITIEAWMKDWAAPPGSVVRLGSDWGPAQGRYIVSTIEKDLAEPTGTIVCKRPMKELPEPAAETVTKSSRKGAGGLTGGNAGTSDLADWAESQIGKYTDANEPFSNALGYGRGIPWCSVFVAYGCKQVGIDISGLSNPAHSSTWLAWSGASKVSVGSVQRGDIVVFDWGDGGETDHVAIYVGGGQVVGGNQSDAVTKVPFQSGSCVGAVRPK